MTELAAAVRPAKRTPYVSLRVKLLVGFSLLFSAVYVGAFYWFYQFSTNAALDFIKSELTDTANGAVEGLDADAFAGLVRDAQPNAAGRTDDPRYQQILSWLSTAHNLDPRAYPYTYVPGPDQGGQRTNYFVVDYLQVADPSRAAGFKEQYFLNSGFSRDGLTEMAYRLEPYTDQWGQWVSAYAPIKDSSGQVVGGLGVDFKADYVYRIQRAILDNVGIAFVATYSVLLVLIFLVSRALTRPIVALTIAAKRIGEGDYAQDLSLLQGRWSRDEIVEMSEVFDIMVAKVSAREEMLARKVEALTIQIDQAQRHREVTEIVETDFFKELQSKARQMRDRHSAAYRSEISP
jgi:methyl-accepting chemotaxis protein